MITETSSILTNGAIGKTVKSIMGRQRAFFQTGITRDVDFRIEQLKRLKDAIEEYETEIFEALKKDLNKSPISSYLTEMALVKTELDLFIKKTKKWSKPKKVRTGLINFKATSKIYRDPYGIVLNISPWNYPFLLCIQPIIGAMAAGNCVVIKPSEMAPATSAVINKMITENFVEDYVAVLEGGIPLSQELLKQDFDYIFYTGSTHVGRIVYQAAAKNLTPVTLELGGKSPCIVDGDINLKVTAKRIAWGKFTNAGQTCVAPDYILVKSEMKDQLVAELKKVINEFYGANPQASPEFCRIINQRHVSRLSDLMEDTNIVEGGITDADDRYISPTIIDGVDPEHPIMLEEIFGPVLPILTYDKLEDAIAFVNERPKPLALYVFTQNNKVAKKVLKETTSGGACVNDTIMHLASDELPFGGVGASGLGAYHGKHSFDTFSHQKGVLNKSTLIDVPLRYVPYKVGLGVLKKATRFIS